MLTALTKEDVINRAWASFVRTDHYTDVLDVLCTLNKDKDGIEIQGIAREMFEELVQGVEFSLSIGKELDKLQDVAKVAKEEASYLRKDRSL